MERNADEGRAKTEGVGGAVVAVERFCVNDGGEEMFNLPVFVHEY